MSDHLKEKWMEPLSFMVLFFLSVKPYNQKKYLGTLLGAASKPNRRLTGGSVRFRPVSIVLNNDNRPEPDGTAGQPAVGFWSRPLVTTHKLLHLNQHQSSHGEHLVNSIGDTPWWCDLLFADILRSLKLDSWIGPISTYQHWSAPFQCVAYWVQPRLAVKGQTLDSSWMVRWYIFTQPAGGWLSFHWPHPSYPVGLCHIG